MSIDNIQYTMRIQIMGMCKRKKKEWLIHGPPCEYFLPITIQIYVLFEYFIFIIIIILFLSYIFQITQCVSKCTIKYVIQNKRCKIMINLMAKVIPF